MNRKIYQKKKKTGTPEEGFHKDTGTFCCFKIKINVSYMDREDVLMMSSDTFMLDEKLEKLRLK